MPYNPALDGLRAFAIVLVVLFHAHAPWIPGGFLGVDVFFVLSGYLITSLLLAELDLEGRLRLLAFWRRRIARLMPAFLVMLAAYLMFAPVAWPQTNDHGTQAALAISYLADYAVAWWGTPQQLSHTWSLAVEMHFYLLWPVLLWRAWRRWKGAELIAVLLTAWVLATLWRWVCSIQGETWEQVYYRTDTHMSGLLLGGWLAAALRDATWRARLQRGLPWLLWLSVAGLLCVRNYWDQPLACWAR